MMIRLAPSEYEKLCKLDEDLAGMTGERDALLERCREAVATINTLLATSACSSKCLLHAVCQCGRANAVEIRDRIAAALKMEIR